MTLRIVQSFDLHLTIYIKDKHSVKCYRRTKTGWGRSQHTEVKVVKSKIINHVLSGKQKKYFFLYGELVNLQIRKTIL